MKNKSILKTAGLFTLALFCSTGLMMAGPPDYDYGDAPDPTYPTLFASDGARHDTADPTGPFLGTARDFEADGQPDFPARGDDTDLLGPSGGDDEDGVFLTGPLVPGSLASVTVVTSGTGPYCLNAWMDFNNDGDWADAGEQIFTDAILALGANFLTFPVPPGADVTTRTYSRWRLNRPGGLSYTGAATDGEVEDYCHSPIHGQKWHDLNADGKSDPNEPGLNGQVIQLYDETGTTLIASATTHDLDHDGTPGINPITERGVYWMHAPSGFCIVREQLDTANVVQTFPANCGAKEYFIWVQCERLGREPKEPDCGPGLDWVELCTVPGTDEMFSAAQIIIESPPGPPFNGEILTMFASGPTFVTRSAPANFPGPNAFIQTEMVEMNLVGHHPAVGRFHARAGTQLLPPPIPNSQGQILENNGDQFVVDSFFDVFFEIQLPEFPIPTLQQMRNDWNGPGAHVETKITQVPPIGSEYIEEDIPLHFPAAFPGPTGPLNEFRIIKLVHKPIHGIDFGNKITNAKRKADLRKKCNRLKKKIRKARKKGQRAKARRLTRAWRKCLRQLRAL